MEIIFDSDDELPLNQSIEIPGMVIVIRAIFYENKKYYPPVSKMNVCIKYKSVIL